SSKYPGLRSENSLTTEQTKNSMTWNNRTVVLHPDVKVVPSTLPDDQLLVNQDCVPLPRTPRPGVVICIHPIQDDIWVSGALKRGQLWEENILMKMQTILQADPSIVLVDIGSNIGLYTLYAAAIGRRAVAVEMLPTNVQHIQKALGLSKLGSDVVIVNNALFSDHRKLGAKFTPQNVGGTYLNVAPVDLVNTTHGKVHVQTICLDDLTPLLEGATVYMKMDIENSEHHALKCAHSFFQRVNVKYVQMEFTSRVEDDREQVMKFTRAHGYTLTTSPDNIVSVDPKKVNVCNCELSIKISRRQYRTVRSTDAEHIFDHNCKTLVVHQTSKNKMKSQGRLTYSILLWLMVIVLWLYVRTGAVKHSLPSRRSKYPGLQRPNSLTTEQTLNLVSWNNRTVVLHSDVKVVPSTLPDDQLLVNQVCVPLPHTPRSGVVICIHPVQDDIWVSGTLKRGQLWEENILMKMQTILQADPSMILVDIGSNIGLYTLYAAAIGRRAVAVEMLPTNVQHIQKALGLSKLDLANTTHGEVNVQTICLDDLTPLLEGATVYMKMDIENSEHHALKCAYSFFQRVNVKYVQMEFTSRVEEDREQIMTFMSAHGYTLTTSPDNIVPVDPKKVNADVYFIKKV
ncbi:hypothetical protein Btru_031082, partial [Bulinus truncatus]